MNLPASLCYVLAVAFLGPLRKFGSRTPALKRFDSHEQYFQQRVADTSRYKKLFAPHASFEGKTVLDLGCNRGYPLHSFLQHEKFNAIGADIVVRGLAQVPIFAEFFTSVLFAVLTKSAIKRLANSRRR